MWYEGRRVAERCGTPRRSVCTASVSSRRQLNPLISQGAEVVEQGRGCLPLAVVVFNFVGIWIDAQRIIDARLSEMREVHAPFDLEAIDLGLVGSDFQIDVLGQHLAQGQFGVGRGRELGEDKSQTRGRLRGGVGAVLTAVTMVDVCKDGSWAIQNDRSITQAAFRGRCDASPRCVVPETVVVGALDEATGHPDLASDRAELEQMRARRQRDVCAVAG